MRRLAIWIAVAAALGVVGFAAGYALSTTWGHDLLRREVESILSDMMEGEVEIDEVRLVFSNGIGLEGHGVRIYPSERGHALQGKTAYIELKEAALLAGDFQLALLVIEDVVLQLSYGQDGRWSFPPLQAALDNSDESDESETQAAESPAEAQRDTPVLEVLAGAEEVARFLLEEEHIADRIVLRRGAVHFEDHSVTSDARPGTRLQRFHLQHIEGILRRPWLSDDGQLALTANLVDPDGNESPVRCTSFVEDGRTEITLAVIDLELAAVSTYVQRLSRQADLEGQISGELRLESRELGTQQILADIALKHLTPTVVVGDKPARLEIPVEVFHTRLEVEPTAARLVGTRLRGSDISLDFEASVERPIVSTAAARLQARLGGLSVGDVRPIIEQMPDADAMLQWFAVVESGTVDRLSMSGRTTLSTWEQLLDGELTSLPAGFLLGAEVSGLTARLEDEDRILDGRFEADWAADRLEVRNATASWRGAPLPELNVTIDGLSNFVGMKSSDFPTNAEPMPGLGLLWDVLMSEEEDGTDEDPAAYRFHVDVDYLDHPILQWPIEDGHVTVRSIPNGSEATVHEATWGGFPVIAELLYLVEPVPALTVGVRASRNNEPIVHDEIAAEPPKRTEGRWGRGRFRLEPETETQGEAPSPLSQMSGAFTLSKASLRLSDVDITVSSNAHVAAEIAVDLAGANLLPIAFQGRLGDADFEDIGPAIGLPHRFVTGRVEASADVVGHLERGKGLYAGLSGTIRAKARDGKIRQKVPLAVKIATATDGFNPFAKSDKLKYETFEAELVLDEGRLTAKRFEIEGPVRIYATGSIDFAEPPQKVDAVVGVFLFQRIRELLGMVPLVNLVVPGSNKGMVGAYYRVRGAWDDPDVEAMTLKSFKEGMPEIITAPVDFIEQLWKSGNGKPAKRRSR